MSRQNCTICGYSVLSQNWENHVMSATHAHKAGWKSGAHPVIDAYGYDAQSADFVAALEEHNIYSRGDLERALRPSDAR